MTTQCCKIMKVKKITMLVLLSLTTYTWSADNSIYIEQAGDYSTVTITQDGSGNKVKGILTNGTAGATTDPAKISGNNQTIEIKQTGPVNSLALGVNTTVGANGQGIGIKYDVSEGSGYNIAYINVNNNGLGVSSGSLIDVTQSGGYANLNLSMLGNTNNFVANTRGGSHNEITATLNANNTVVNIDQSGGGQNETTLNMTGDKGTSDITTIGALNITDLTQSGGSVNGAYFKLDTIGSSNSVTVNQSGLFDNSTDVKLRGSNNVATVTQSGGSSAGQRADVDVTGSTNTIALTQQGSVDNLTNLKITSGNNNSYTILQKN